MPSIDYVVVSDWFLSADSIASLDLAISLKPIAFFTSVEYSLYIIRYKLSANLQSEKLFIRLTDHQEYSQPFPEKPSK